MRLQSGNGEHGLDETDRAEANILAADEQEALTEDEGMLAARVQAGDCDAFNVLAISSRGALLRTAYSIVGDWHLAEDVVQEALLRAFLRIGQLADSHKVVPWLRAIVRNQAFSARRADCNDRIVLPMSAGVPFSREMDASVRNDWDRVCGAGRLLPDETDPAGLTVRSESAAEMRMMLEKLHERERSILEAQAFAEMSPHEIANRFGVSADHVYNSLSRSRQKMKEEREQSLLGEYVREARALKMYRGADRAGRPERLIVPMQPAGHDWSRCRTSEAVCFRILLQKGWNAGWSLTDVMGLTSFAFRLQVDDEKGSSLGPHHYFWETIIPQGLHNLGASCRMIGDGGVSPSAYALEKGIERIEEAIAAGKPAMVWELASPGFGIVHGYDARRQLLFALEGKSGATVPYGRIGRGQSSGLFVLTADRGEREDDAASLRRAMEMALLHLYGERCPTGSSGGLQAYDSWIRLEKAGCADVQGSVYTASLACNARQYAVRFLRKRAEGSYRGHMLRAAELYAESAYDLQAYIELYENGRGSRPALRKEHAETAVSILRQARLAEEEAAASLEQAIRFMRTTVI